MALKPIAPHHARDGNRGVLYAGPKWLQWDGVNWGEIDDQVTTTLARGYRLALPNGQWAECNPSVHTAHDIGNAIIGNRTGRLFGPTLTLANTPDTMQWTVTASHGAKWSPHGDVELGIFNGVKVGMFFQRDWGDMMTYNHGTITLDLRARKTWLALRGYTVFDLDPTITLGVSAWRNHQFVQGTAGLDWDTDVRQSPVSGNSGNAFFDVVASDFASSFFCHRTASVWDMGGVTSAATAALKATQVGGDSFINSVHVSSATANKFIGIPPTNASNYANCKDAYDTTPIGTLGLFSNEVDIVNFLGDDPLHLSFAFHAHDVLFAGGAQGTPTGAPAEGVLNQVILAKPGDANEVFIEYEPISVLDFERQHRGVARGCWRGHT